MNGFQTFNFNHLISLSDVIESFSGFEADNEKFVDKIRKHEKFVKIFQNINFSCTFLERQRVVILSQISKVIDYF
jgi:hypothetical protein